MIRPRERRRRDWPTGLREPRPGYFTWRSPSSGQELAIGRVSLEQAKQEARLFSRAFQQARELAGIKGPNPPTFHEIRSLAKRLYLEQGGVDSKALLGHLTEKMGELYADPRGVAPIRVRLGSK